MDYFLQIGSDNKLMLQNQNTDWGNVEISEKITLSRFLRCLSLSSDEEIDIWVSPCTKDISFIPYIAYAKRHHYLHFIQKGSWSPESL